MIDGMMEIGSVEADMVISIPTQLRLHWSQERMLTKWIFIIFLYITLYRFDPLLQNRNMHFFT